MQKNEFEMDPLDVGSPDPEPPQWFKVEGRLGERFHPVGPKFDTGHVRTNCIQHAKESYLAYFGQYFDSVEVLKVTPVGSRIPRGHIFPTKRNIK